MLTEMGLQFLSRQEFFWFSIIIIPLIALLVILLNYIIIYEITKTEIFKKIISILMFIIAIICTIISFYLLIKNYSLVI